jgi:hypothetical protein
MNNPDKKNSSLPIGKILGDQRYSIAGLCHKANSIQELNQKLKTYLDPSLNDHFELANINTDSVTILVSSSTWATRLRYNIPVILNTLNNNLKLTSVKTVRIKVNNKVSDPTSKAPKKAISMSQNSAQVLIDVANNLDPKLRECFIKLSKNVRQ